MTENMLHTTLVLAMYMADQLIEGNQDFVSRSHVADLCVLPMGFMEQVPACGMG